MTKPEHYIDTIYYDMELTAHAMRALGASLFEQLQFEVTPLEHAALDTIYCNEGICQRDLAKLILKDRANTGRVLDSLEEKGLITRFIDMKNNRLVKKMSVTEKGIEKLKFVNKKMEEYLNSISSEISDEEIQNLQQSIKRFRETILKVVNMQI